MVSQVKIHSIESHHRIVRNQSAILLVPWHDLMWHTQVTYDGMFGMKTKRDGQPKWSNNKTKRIWRYATQRARNSRTSNSSCNQTWLALLRGKTDGQPLKARHQAWPVELSNYITAGGRAGSAIKRNRRQIRVWERIVARRGEMVKL